jgi:hypothetical protein
MKTDEYIAIYKFALEQTGDEQAAIAIMQEVGKNERQREYRGGNEPATQKQLEYLKDLDEALVREGMTKYEASQAIDEAKLKQEKKAGK